MIGDKKGVRSKLWYQDAELEDKLEMAMLRHESPYLLDTIPANQMMLICYRAAVDVCLELAAKAAPFAIQSFERMTSDKTTVINNWLQLSNVYKDLYVTEINGGLGKDGEIRVGELTRRSYTTGRDVPYYMTEVIGPVVVKLVSITGRLVKINWNPARDPDLFAYYVYRKTSTAADWNLISSIYNLLNTDFEETLEAAGTYNYKVATSRSVSNVKTVMFPFSPQIQTEITVDSNVVTVKVS